MKSRQSQSRDPSGTVVEGHGFYVWSEDAREAQLWGRELARAVGGRSGDSPALLKPERTGKGCRVRLQPSSPAKSSEAPSPNKAPQLAPD